MERTIGIFTQKGNLRKEYRFKSFKQITQELELAYWLTNIACRCLLAYVFVVFLHTACLCGNIMLFGEATFANDVLVILTSVVLSTVIFNKFVESYE